LVHPVVKYAIAALTQKSMIKIQPNIFGILRVEVTTLNRKLIKKFGKTSVRVSFQKYSRKRVTNDFTMPILFVSTPRDLYGAPIKMPRDNSRLLLRVTGSNSSTFNISVKFNSFCVTPPYDHGNHEITLSVHSLMKFNTLVHQ